MTKLLQVNGLSTHFTLPIGNLKVVDNLDLAVQEGETHAIVGESGCGKSMTALSIMRLVPPPGAIVSGEIIFEDNNLRSLSDREMQQVRGNRISIIFQEPMTSLNPVFRIGDQIAEGILLHRKLPKRAAKEMTIDMLNKVGIPAPASRYNDYPHQLSGGMRQRVMIAMALSCEPRLLIADEPTTALDVTIQAQILELIDDLKREFGMGLLLITHDLGVVAERAHRTSIMYAGKIVETGPTEMVLRHPLHPYTAGLLSSLPQRTKPGKPLSTIPGQVPNLLLDLPGCGFCERCSKKERKCPIEPPPFLEIHTGHFVRCWKHA